MVLLIAGVQHAARFLLVLVCVIYGRQVQGSPDGWRSISELENLRPSAIADASKVPATLLLALSRIGKLPRITRYSPAQVPRNQPGVSLSLSSSKDLPSSSMADKLGPSRLIPSGVWPGSQGRSHRFIEEDDPTYQECAFNEVTGYTCKTPEKFQGTRRDGAYVGTCRVQFTLPDQDLEPLTLELLRSNGKDNPSFGAVKLQLPFDATVKYVGNQLSKQGRLTVKFVEVSGNVDQARIRKGDILRAISIPETTGTQEQSPWWKVGADTMLGRAQVPESENGMVILDSRSVAEFNAVLEQCIRTNTNKAEVVLIIERPVNFGPFDDDRPNFWGGMPVKKEEEGDLSPQLIPIPVPVDKGSPFPGLPSPPQPPLGGGGYPPMGGY